MSRFSGPQTTDTKKGTRHNKGVMRTFRERKRKEAEERMRTASTRECGHRHTDNGAKGCNSLLLADRPMVGGY